MNDFDAVEVADHDFKDRAYNSEIPERALKSLDVKNLRLQFPASPVCRPLHIETYRHVSPFSMAKNPGNWLVMLRFRRNSRLFG